MVQPIPCLGSEHPVEKMAQEGCQGEDEAASADFADNVDEKDPWSKEYVPQQAGLSEPTRRDYAFTFLFAQKRSALRELAQLAGTRRCGVKNSIACHLLAYADQQVSSKKASYDEAFGDLQQEFWGETRNQTQRIWIAPDILMLSRYRASTGGQKSADNHGSPWSVSEFARLMAILTDSEEAKHALIRSGTALNRNDLQRRANMDSFWVDIIEPLFNDPNKKFSLNIRGCVRGDTEMDLIDVNASPSCFRSGSALRAKFVSVRAHFTTAYSNWSTSGQLDAEGSDFDKFVPRAVASQEISSVGRLVCVLFYALRCGTDAEETEILNFTSKMAPFGSGFDDDDDADTLSARGGSQRKRRKVSDDSQASAVARDEKLGQMSDALIQFLSTVQTRGAGSSTVPGAEEKSSLLLSQVADLTRQRASLLECSSADDAITSRTLNLLETQISNLQDELDECLQTATQSM